MSKKSKEWNVPAPWGKIAVVSWGDPSNPPILLVHGYMDTAATFAILVDQLLDKYYYVGLDLPGHGKSDPLPGGIIAVKTHMVEPIRLVVEYMKWKKFIYMSHSMSCIMGLIYNQVYPDRIKKMVLLDAKPPLSWYYVVQHKLPLWVASTYTRYYDDYQKMNSSKPRLHTYDKALSLVVRNRSLTEEQADIVLSRSLIPMGIDTYKMSWEPRMKSIIHITLPEETLYTIMTSKMPPTLSIEASEYTGLAMSELFAENLLRKCEQTLLDFYRITVTGGHDVHITSPELLAPSIEEFLSHKRVVSWGKPENPPILLVHGRSDTAATFKILVDWLPDNYFYVAFDMPGNGKSDPLPPGLHVNHLHIVEALRLVVEHMKWQKFIYMAHSIGCMVGLHYNHLNPGHIKKMILIDPSVALCRYYNVHHRLPYYYSSFIRDYYDDYLLRSSDKPKLHTYEKAISLVVRNRSLTEEQAEVVLSRSLVPVGTDTYKLSWDPRMKKIFQVPVSEETLYTIMTEKIPPTLCVDASEFKLESYYKEYADNFLKKCERLSKFHRITLIGGHDLHITSPKALAERIVDFLERSDIETIFEKSKL